MKKLLLITITAIALLLNPMQASAKEDVVIPPSVRMCCDYWGKQYGICSELLQSICWHETRCRAELSMVIAKEFVR